MYKEQFLRELEAGLAGLPQPDIEERLAFYSEMIDDRMEDGMPEEEAVACAGPVDEIVSQTVADIPFTRIVKERVRPKNALRAWEVVLLILGFPLWFPLLLAAGAIVLSLYIVVLALLVSLWAVELSFAVSAVASLAAGAFIFVQGGLLPGVFLFGVALFLGGLSIFLYYGCIAASKGLLRLTGSAAQHIKTMFIRKENVR